MANFIKNPQTQQQSSTTANLSIQKEEGIQFL